MTFTDDIPGWFL